MNDARTSASASQVRVPGPRSVDSADRLNRRLVYAILVAVTVILGLVAWILVAGLTRPMAPRTAVERDVYAAEAAVRAKSTDQQAWANYAAALVNAGRLSDALAAIADGEKAVGKVPGLLLAHARVLNAQSDWAGALKEADESIKSSLALRKKKVDEVAAKGAYADPKSFYGKEIIAAQVFRAEILVSRARVDDAIAAYSNALEQLAQMSDVLVARGELYARQGRYADARKDYQAALQYIPGYQPALKGLTSLEEVGK
jgi:tetratricopeptide (TPR) repeat protein